MEHRDVIRGHNRPVRGTLPARRGFSPRNYEFGDVDSTYQPKHSPLHNIQDKKTRRAATGAMGTDWNRNVPPTTPNSTPKKSSTLQRIKSRFNRA